MVLEMMAFGMKGAALAALGEMAAAFFAAAPAAPAIAPLGEREDGVKLGESTFSDFLSWALVQFQHVVLSPDGLSDLSEDTGLAPLTLGDLKSDRLWL